MLVRPRLALLVAVLALFPVLPLGPASAQSGLPEPGSADGVYQLTVTTTRDCEQEDGAHFKLGGVYPQVVGFEQSGSTITLTIEGQPIQGSIDNDLNFDIVVDINHWIGHFSVQSNGDKSTIAGEVVGTCQWGTGPFMKITGSRSSGGPSPSPSPSPSLFPGGEPGLDAAEDAGSAANEDLCGGDPENQPCLAADHYGIEWDDAMAADIAALSGLPTEEDKVLLSRLRTTLSSAATLGQLHCPGSDTHAFPAVSALLPVFGRLFVQAVTQVARSRALDDLELTVFYADTLLKDALNGFSLDLAAGNRTYPCPNLP